MAAKRTVATYFQDESLLSDEADESLWDSAARNASNTKSSAANHANNGMPSRSGQNPSTSYDDQETRDVALRQELESVRKVNDAIEGVIESLGRAHSSMKTVNQTVNAASTLLNTWTRILSQTEHNQRLILDPSWQGASQDIADMEREIVTRQQAAERREAEELERRTAAARRAEEDERRRAEASNKTFKPATRARARAGARGSSSATSASTGYVGVGGSANTSTSSISRGLSSATRRGTSGIGRGPGTRGRGRGV